MVFANLPPQEKDAFFSLLDEYFQSRPDLIPNAAGSSDHGAAGSSAGGAAASAVQRAMASNPDATAKLFSAGLKHGVPKNSPYAAAAHNPEINNAAGRFAAASMAMNQSHNKPPQRPPAPPRRTSSSADSEQEPSSIANANPGQRNLTPVKRFGDVDTSSAKNLFGSLRNSTANKSAPTPPLANPLPPAFSAKKNAFAPPPVRRVASTASSSQESAAPTPPPAPRRPAVHEPEVEGEWAEATYAYTSSDAGDLQLAEGQRVLVTDKTSDDWWTGEADGKTGLFPASYVRLL